MQRAKSDKSAKKEQRLTADRMATIEFLKQHYITRLYEWRMQRQYLDKSIREYEALLAGLLNKTSVNGQ